MTDECTICLERVSFPCTCQPCGHIYCADCIWSWIVKSRHCPQCREFVGDLQYSANNIQSKMPKFRRDNYDFKRAIQKYVIPFLIKASYILLLLIVLRAVFVVSKARLTADDTTPPQSTLGSIVTFFGACLWEIVTSVFWLLFYTLTFPLQVIVHFTEYLNAFVKVLSEMFWVLVYLSILTFVLWHFGVFKHLHGYLRSRNIM